MNDGLRIGDADRESAARELGEHYALGRITPDEHSERLEQIWAARTAADLAPAFRDLPRPGAPRQQPSVTPRRTAGWWQMPYLPFPFRLLVAIVAIWWGFHHLLFFLVAALVYVLFLRRFVRHHRRYRRSDGPWRHHHHSTAGWN